MKICKLQIKNFRGIRNATLHFDGDTVIVGDNNTGKSSILEAIDLVLGPERLSRYPIIDEHDFYAGEYISEEGEQIEIEVEVIIVDLSVDQQSTFRDNLEWWDSDNNSMIDSPPVESIEEESVIPALRVKFVGYYDEEEDDFTGDTFFCSPINEDETYSKFYKRDKRECGFLFLRTLRTGSRALSLEKGSLLDIILRLQELRPKMWEDILNELRSIPIAEDEDLGISPILEEVQDQIRSYVPSEWATNPRLRVSDLTRVHLRKLLTVFMDTGALSSDGSNYSAPFQHQGTGTINTLVLTLLTMIAELKQNVIFAMEEPEIAIPPHTQKRIVLSVASKSEQAIFTSHSPYVLEEFKPEHVLVAKNESGELSGKYASYPPAVKPKKYKEDFKRKFCETLLARRVLITEGRTEYDAITSLARKLSDDDPETFSSLEALGISVINAETDSQVAPLGEFFQELGKEVFAIFDKQGEDELDAIEQNVDHPFESPEKSFEKLVLKHTDEEALKRYALQVVDDGEWPSHLRSDKPTEESDEDEVEKSLRKLFKWSKGSGTCADLLCQCDLDEIPEFLGETLAEIKEIVEEEEEDMGGMDLEFEVEVEPDV